MLLKNYLIIILYILIILKLSNTAIAEPIKSQLNCKIIDQNLQAPSMIELITSSSIYIPLIAFFCLLIITIFIRKIFYKN